MPTRSEAKDIYDAISKNESYYDRLNDEGKSTYWQYARDNGFTSIDKLNDAGKAEFNKYVKTDWSRYEPNITPSNMADVLKYDKYASYQGPKVPLVNSKPAVIPPAIPSKRIGGRQLEDYENTSNTKVIPKQQLPINTNIRGKAVVQQGKIANPNLVRPDNLILKGIGNTTLGTLNTINSVVQAPATVGKYGVEEMNKAKAEGKSQIGGLLKGYGIGLGKAITGQEAVSNTEVVEGIAPKTTAAVKEKYPGAYKLASEIVNMVDITDLTALGILGDLAKVQKLGKLPDTTKALIKANAQNLAEISIKKKAEQALTADEAKLVDAIKQDIMYVDPYGNVRKTPTTDLQLEAPKPKNMDTAEWVNSLEKVNTKDKVSYGIGKGNIEAPFRITPAENAKLTKLDALQGSTTEAKISGNINPQPKVKPLPTVATGTQNKTIKEVVETAQGKKDISGFQAYTTDVYRNFKEVFKEDFPTVKAEVLDKFDAAKKAKTVEDRVLMADLKKNIVDKFNIQKGSKDSALVQQFGEKRISEAELIAKVGKAKADKIVEADKYFRETYDRLIDEVNTARVIVYPNNPEKLIPKRKDYYRHFKELSDDFAGLKNIFETPSQISPSLAGTSEFTKPKSKFLSFAQKRGNGEFTDDAVGGFLDYINAATYAKHIDTQIPTFRALAADLAKSTEQSKNLNNFIGYLTDFSNDLAGKTNPADRFVQKIIPGGRTTFKAINWLNSRVKANTILGNVSSSLSQIANIPQGIAYVKDPVSLSKGAGNYLSSIFGKGDAKLYKQSGFILERYADNVARQFDVKILDQPKKAAAWMLGALDEMGTKFIWSSTYQKALADGITDPIKYADDVARKLVGGRGIGEVPLLQKSKIMQLVAPFTLEVNNLWKVQKDFVKAKDFGGLALLYLANFALNKGMEEVRGNGVVFDPIKAIADSISEFKDSDTELKTELDSKQAKYNNIANKNRKEAVDLKKEIDELKSGIKTPLQKTGLAAGRLTGEVLSNTPMGSTLATLYPEYGVNNDLISLPTREKLFGRNDPTRFGGGLLAVKGLQDPVYKLLPSFGGGQIKKTVQAGQDLGLLPKLKKQEGKILPKLEKQDMPASYSNTKAGDRIRTTIDPKPSTIAKGLAFGRGAIPEVKKYYESGKVPLSTTQTANIKKLVDKGYEPNKLFETLNGIRGTNKKADIVVKLRESGYNSKQIDEIWEIFYK